MNQGTLSTYIAGFVGTVILSLAAFFVATAFAEPKMGIDMAVAAFAVVQAALVLFFYLDLGKETKPHWNLIVFLFMLLVTVLIVVGSLWIMYHLNYNLMVHE